MSFEFLPHCWTTSDQETTWCCYSRISVKSFHSLERYSFFSQPSHVAAMCLSKAFLRLNEASSTSTLGSSQDFELWFIHIPPKITACESHKCFSSKHYFKMSSQLLCCIFTLPTNIGQWLLAEQAPWWVTESDPDSWIYLHFRATEPRSRDVCWHFSVLLLSLIALEK